MLFRSNTVGFLAGKVTKCLNEDRLTAGIAGALATTATSALKGVEVVDNLKNIKGFKLGFVIGGLFQGFQAGSQVKGLAGHPLVSAGLTAITAYYFGARLSKHI